LRNGRFITFEGGEGAGKSTQIRRLAASLRGQTREVVVTREPGGTPLAEKLRTVILAGKARDFGDMGEALLFSAARIDHIDRVIRPALARGAAVLCDRFADSTRAYQGARGGAEDIMLATLEKVTLAGVQPDITFILDIAPDVGMERAHRRRGQGAVDRFEAEDLGFHMLLRAKFLEIARDEPDRCRVIDAARPEDEVAEAIWAACLAKWPELASGRKQWA
jgi:dTMP kinase